MRTIRRNCHLHERIVLGRRGTEPAGMANRSATLPRLSLGRAFRGLVLDGRCLVQVVRGKFGLPIEHELEFQTLNLSFKRLILGHQIRDRLPRGVQLAVGVVQAVAARVGCEDYCSERRAPEMRTMAKVRASEFVFGVEAELHERSSLNAGKLADFAYRGQPNSLHCLNTRQTARSLPPDETLVRELN